MTRSVFWRHLRLPLAAGACLAALSAVALGVLPQQQGTVDLLTQANVTLNGAAAGDLSGYSVASAGDVNGDGLADVIVGVRFADPSSGADAGSSYVIYGTASPSDIDLSSLGSSGFRIDGAAAGDNSGWSVASAGDVNGDGRADVIVGAPYADPPSRNAAGSSYVIYGTASPSNVNLASLDGSSGFRIDGAAAGDNSGISVASAGDVNGDGRADLIVGAYYADPFSRNLAGSTYVVYGNASPSDVDLSALGARGFRIDGAGAGDNSGKSVASAGDVNGDGLADVIVGAPYADPAGLISRSNAGSSYVVYGNASPSDVDLSSLGSGGFRIDGDSRHAGDNSGWSVASAGDVNRDGFADVIVGAPYADPSSGSSAGSSYVIYGKAAPSDVDLSFAGFSGFRVDGAAAGDQSGWSVASAGDVNGDGLADVIVGAPYADPSSRADAGSSYVIYGKASPSDVDLSSLGSSGFRADGGAAGDLSGYSVASAGDVNGDGRADVIVGAPLANPSSRSGAGSSYLFGFGTALVSYPGAITATVGTPITSLTPTVRRTGAASFSVSPALPAGLSLDAATGVISGTPTEAATATSTVTMTDLSGTASTTVSVTVEAAPTSAPAAQPAALKVRMTCKGTVCTTRGTLPAGATRIGQSATAGATRTGQSATAVGKKAARAKCSVKATGKGKKIKRTFACRLGVKKGTWTVTTSARAKNGTIVAQSVVTKRVR